MGDQQSMGDQQLVGGNHGQLPDYTIRDILSRLPLRTILRYQLVCRRWKDLTSSPYFSQNKKLSIPMIFLEKKTNSDSISKRYRYRLVSKNMTENRVDTVLENSEYRIQFLWDGLMFLRSNQDYMVLNPITREKVKIRPQTFLIHPCGLFFHPVVEEYCILWMHWPFKSSGFKVLNLGTKMCWRDLMCNSSSLPNCTKFAPVNCPIVVKDILYWLFFYLREHMTDWSCQIFAFDIRREEISLVPYPDSNYRFSNFPENPNEYPWNHMRTVEMNGQLSLVQSSGISKNSQDTWTIRVWILMDYPNALWIKISTIDLGHVLHRPVALWINIAENKSRMPPPPQTSCSQS